MGQRPLSEGRHREPGAAQAKPWSSPVDVTRVRGNTVESHVPELKRQLPPPHSGSWDGQHVGRHEENVLSGDITRAGRCPHGWGEDTPCDRVMGVGMEANHIRQHRRSVVVLGGGVQQFMRVVVESLPGDKVFHVDHFRRVLEGLHFPRKHRTCGDWARRRERRFFDTHR